MTKHKKEQLPHGEEAAAEGLAHGVEAAGGAGGDVGGAGDMFYIRTSFLSSTREATPRMFVFPCLVKNIVKMMAVKVMMVMVMVRMITSLPPGKSR